MAKRDAVYASLPDDKLIQKEYKRIFELFSGADPEQLELAKGEIAHAATLKVTLDRLAADIIENGYSEEYQNGENQTGKKERTEARLYNNYTKNYISLMKQLHEFLDKLQPQNAVKDADKDAFEEF